MDNQFMKRALELAENGVGKTSPNPLVGAVIVKNGKIIGEGWHERFGQAHAEVNAVNNASESMEAATVYVTLEPCCHYGKTPPCTELLIEKKVGRIVIGTLDPNPLVAGKGAERLREAGVEVDIGALEQECQKQNEVFFHFMKTHRPFVVMKAAMSLDGKIAAPSGESKWITEEEARKDVQKLRNRYPAIMVGVGTVITDDPELTCRIEKGRNPVRIILDSGLRTPLSSKVLMDQKENTTWIVCTERASAERVKQVEALGVEVIRCRSRNNQIDLAELMEKLGQRSIDSILLEGGGTVNDSALKQGIVNKIILYVAPKIIGGETSRTFVGGQGITKLNQAYPLQIESMERIGEDLKIVAYRKEG